MYDAEYKTGCLGLIKLTARQDVGIKNGFINMELYSREVMLLAYDHDKEMEES